MKGWTLLSTSGKSLCKTPRGEECPRTHTCWGTHSTTILHGSLAGYPADVSMRLFSAEHTTALGKGKNSFPEFLCNAGEGREDCQKVLKHLKAPVLVQVFVCIRIDRWLLSLLLNTSSCIPLAFLFPIQRPPLLFQQFLFSGPPSPPPPVNTNTGSSETFPVDFGAAPHCLSQRLAYKFILPSA